MVGTGTRRGARRLGRRPAGRYLALLLGGSVAVGCGLQSLGVGGGSLRLTVTDMQTRPLVVEVDAPAGVRVVEVAPEESALGQGRVRLERYVLQRVTFGSGLATGLFLCSAPCPRPMDTYLVAFSPDQLFEADGELRLGFRLVDQEGAGEELVHIVAPAVLPALWERPLIRLARSEGAR